MPATVDKDWQNQLLYFYIGSQTWNPDPLLEQSKRLTSIIADPLLKWIADLQISADLTDRHIWKISSLAGDYFYKIYQVNKWKQTEINISGTPESEFVNLVQQKLFS